MNILTHHMLNSVIGIMVAVGTWKNDNGEFHGLTSNFGYELYFDKYSIDFEALLKRTLEYNGASRAVHGNGDFLGCRLVASQRFDQLVDHFVEGVDVVIE
jgi:hypothetical protein